MPFGLKNASATFQRAMDHIFRNINNIVIYLDDILIGSEDLNTHILDIKNVFNKLLEFGFKINILKCEFLKEEINFLGYTIRRNQLRPIKEKLETILNLPFPKTVRDIRRLVGMINFYHQCIPHCAQMLSLLTDLIKGRKKYEKIDLNQTDKAKFRKIKELLSKITSIQMLQENSKLRLTTDASIIAIGAVLEQTLNEKPVPVGFYSRKLKVQEKRYSTFDR